MEAFEPKDFEYPIKKPSFDSVVRQKRRAQIQQEEQLQYTVIPDEEQSVEPVYTETEQKIMDEAAQLSLVGHLAELRQRIIIMAIAVVIGTGIAYYYVDFLLELLLAPGGKLYYMRPTEAFFTYLKVSVVGGFVIATPVILYQIWGFVKPALTVREKSISNWVLPVAIILFIIGIVFSYTLVLPAAVVFFMGFATDELQPMFSVGQYLDFVLSFVLPFGFIFELPLIIIIMGYFNLITSQFLKTKRKFFILLAFIIGAVISPTPDMFSQIMIALPMILLYETSLFVLANIMKR
ncbi:twin-arginine translocase subunit TatC [Veillonella agrestimuris]|uniref:twin-arginine translocase subunit TatC n=1 Tax=Veillonella agrestimuris TaxID=2941340 RepID=UPI00203E9F96|nr:twin-arginine translocase subunit TatC [Veillonella agrestimuris]